ncbi:MAG: XTP/dITP diphosphatase [bacterium]
MTKAIVLATKNQDKINEIKKLLCDVAISVLTLAEFPDAPDVIEDGRTLRDNAGKKAEAIGNFTGLPAVADDTGLEVDFLGGKPGVLSSRYSGVNATYEENVAKLLSELKGVPWEKRKARFRCVVGFYEEETTRFVEGICEGFICETPRGAEGFGYDPVFYLPEYGKTFAEIGLQAKNKISHRANAFSAFKELLKNN